MKKKAIVQQHEDEFEQEMPMRLYGIGGDLAKEIYRIINNELGPDLIIGLKDLQGDTQVKRNVIENIHKYFKNLYKEKYEERKELIGQVINNYLLGLLDKLKTQSLKPAGSSLAYKQYILRMSQLDTNKKK